MKVDVCGLHLDAITMGEAIAAVDAAVQGRRQGQPERPLAIFSVNVDMLVKAHRDPVFARELGQAGLLLADGTPVLWMSRCLGRRLPERVAGSDLLPRLAERAAIQGHRLFLFGAPPGVAARAAERLTRDHPGLQIAGTFSPPYGFERDQDERQRALEVIQRARPDVVAVALGAPKQERWILADGVRTGAAALLACGGTFEMLAGLKKRAPQWAKRTGLEWLWRLAQDPARLARRYLVDDLTIIPVFGNALWQRFTRALSRR
jgi:N-acetylglucosaminyldiphosphoundecaprenol N-acetyl-beta-D-mannosaminyltransferase